MDLVTGSGPNVAANTQVGAENTQTLGVSNSTDFTVTRPQARDIVQSSDATTVKADKVDTVINNDTSWWMVVLLILGWLAPSPSEIGKRIRGLWKKES